jgi:hypothetical protein
MHNNDNVNNPSTKQKNEETREKCKKHKKELEESKKEKPYIRYIPQLSMIHKLPKYVILNNFVTIIEEKDMNQLSKYVSNYKLKPNNDVVQGKYDDNGNPLPNDPDHFRYQIKPPYYIAWIKKIKDKLTSLVTSHFHSVSDKSEMTILYSKPGCVQQILHTDYPLETAEKEQLKEEDFSFFALVALMDNTSIILGNGNILVIEKGDVLFARGDLVHAGNSYADSNIRLHIYFDNKNFRANKERNSYTTEDLDIDEKKECVIPPINLRNANFLLNKIASKIKNKRKQEMGYNVSNTYRNYKKT